MKDEATVPNEGEGPDLRMPNGMTYFYCPAESGNISIDMATGALERWVVPENVEDSEGNWEVIPDLFPVYFRKIDEDYAYIEV